MRDALHLARRQVDHLRREVLGQLVRGAEDRLRGRPDGQSAILVPLGDEAVRLEALMADVRGAVLALDDGVGALEAVLEVVGLALDRRAEVVAFLLRADRRDRLLVFLQGVLFEDEVIEDGVLDLDGANRILSLLLGLGGEGQDFVAGEEEFLSLFFDDVDGADAGHLLGGGGVDRLDGGVGVRRAQDAGVQHADAVDVEAVFRLAGRFGGAVDAAMFFADEAALFGPSGSHESLLSR